MSNTLQSVHLLKDKLEKLLSNYEILKQENEVLLGQNDKLRLIIREKEQELANCKEKIKMLKIAKTIQGSKENTRETKLKINALIREIDKCIVQLNS
ncbi:MAG: hypothetical protein CR961_01485 [Polaribacter sp.]|nr:MAG: hypothetical protein CR961_01485 [Polaribacter sp.]